jgi:hypothetical protein
MKRKMMKIKYVRFPGIRGFVFIFLINTLALFLLPSSKALMTFSGTRSKYRRQSSTNPSPRSGNRSRTWETSESSSTPEISGTLFGFLEGSD